MALSAKYGKVTVENEPGTPLNDTDEPVFLIRAQDTLAVGMILFYRDEYERKVHNGEMADDDEMVQRIRADAGWFERWQQDHREVVKVPD